MLDNGRQLRVQLLQLLDHLFFRLLDLCVEAMHQLLDSVISVFHGAAVPMEFLRLGLWPVDVSINELLCDARDLVP